MKTDTISLRHHMILIEGGNIKLPTTSTIQDGTTLNYKR